PSPPITSSTAAALGAVARITRAPPIAASACPAEPFAESTYSSAPSCVARGRLSSPRAMATVRKPMRWANCTARCPRPPSPCPAPGSGTSRVISSSAAFAAGKRATVIVAMGMKVPRQRAHARGRPATLRLFRRRLPRARGGALEQQLALPSVSGERCRALELVTRLVEAAELREQVAAHARQEVVALEQRL